MIVKCKIVNILLLSLISVTIGCSRSIVKQTNLVVAGKDIIKDSMQYLQNDRVKLGIDLNLGGAVTFLSDKENGGQNMINSYDWGRQIQMSYYSGPWPYIGPNGEKPTPEWEGLGWNPIQSGDAGNHRAKLIAFERKGDHAIFVRSIPMQWPHKTGVTCECEFQSLYTLNGNVITLEATIVNYRKDKTQYRAGSQEMPAIYTNGPWYKVVTYLGDRPFEGDEITTIVDKNDGKGWPWVHFYSPENWVALLDDNGKGIGVIQPDIMKFNAGFHPDDSKKGFGGDKDAQTGHIAPIGTQILDHNIKWVYKTIFVLGDIQDIRNYAKQQRNVSANPSWNFDNSRQMWYYEGECKDSGFPIKNGLDITFNKGAKMVSPVTYWKASANPFLELEAAIDATEDQMEVVVEIQPMAKSDLTDWLNWTEGSHNVDAERKYKETMYPSAESIQLTQKIDVDGKSKKYRIDLSQIPNYDGAMKSVKIHFKGSGKAQVKSIKLGQ